MDILPVLINVVILIALVVFVWKRIGPGSGRAYGNRIASHIGIPKNTFWYLLENGTSGSTVRVLAAMEKSGLGLQRAAIKLAPTLQKGLERLETRFGTQAIYEEAKPVVAKLLASQHEE